MHAPAWSGRIPASTARHGWSVASELCGSFTRLGHPIPAKVRIGVGFRVRGIAAKNQWIGECGHPSAAATITTKSSSRRCSPIRCASRGCWRTTDTAAIGSNMATKGRFGDGYGAGLEGKMTATTEGDAFKRLAQPILDALGPYPHAELHAMSNRRRTGGEADKCECEQCEYVARSRGSGLTTQARRTALCMAQ